MGPIETTLRKARHLIGLEENWSQHELESADRTSWCALGALFKASTGGSGVLSKDHSYAWELLSRNAPQGNVVLFNNTHTHAEVLDMFDRAIKQAAEDGA